jgi:hypothetical protein
LDSSVNNWFLPILSHDIHIRAGFLQCKVHREARQLKLANYLICLSFVIDLFLTQVSLIVSILFNILTAHMEAFVKRCRAQTSKFL